MAKFVRPADAYRARHRSPADAYRAKYRDAGSIQSALAGLRVDDGVASASLAGLPDDLWRRICAFARPATSATSLIVAAGRSASLRHALRAEVAQTEKSLYGMTRSEAAYRLCMQIEDFPADPSELGEYTLSMMNEAFLRTITGELFLLHYGEPLMIAKAFLAYGVEPDYARRSTGKTALMFTPELASAGWGDALELAIILIKNGADVHATCNHGCTPLVYAFRSLQILIPTCVSSYNESANLCASVASLISDASTIATCRSLRGHRELYRDPESRFEAVQARLLSQENDFMSRYDPYDGYEALCEITEPFLGSMTKDMMTTGWDYKLLFPMLELRCKMQVITKIGLDREAVGEHYEFRATPGPHVLKELMYMIQGHIRKIVQKGW